MENYGSRMHKVLKVWIYNEVMKIGILEMATFMATFTKIKNLYFGFRLYKKYYTRAWYGIF